MTVPGIRYVIASPNEATVKVKRSTFIGFVQPAQSVEEAKEGISARSRANHRATHNCWAYIIGMRGDVEHSSDAGEPSGSAGRPILNVLKSHDLTNIIAVVTRHYGGVKLGVRGLIDAYSEATLLALEKVPLQELVAVKRFHVELQYPLLDRFNHRIAGFRARQLNADFTNCVKLTLAVPDDQVEAFVEYVTLLAAAEGIVWESA